MTPAQVDRARDAWLNPPDDDEGTCPACADLGVADPGQLVEEMWVLRCDRDGCDYEYDTWP